MPYKIKLIKSEQIADRTMAFHWEKPKGFQYKAGQYGDYTLIDPPFTDAEGNIRSFSFAEPPEGKFLSFATRMRETAFKKILLTYKPGAEISVDGPFGSFVLHNNAARPAVLIAGGIGITPFRSIIQNAAKEKLPHKIFLFYSNRRPEDAAYLQELEEAQALNPNYRFIGLMTNMEDSKIPWAGETGRLNEKIVAKYIPKLPAPIYYLAGPPGLVSGMRKMLNGAGVNDDDIRAEEFPGY